MLLLFSDFVQDYMQNVHGKEIDLLRTTVKVPGKRPPRAVATVAPTASPKTNGLTKDRSTLQLGIGNTGKSLCLITKAKIQLIKCGGFTLSFGSFKSLISKIIVLITLFSPNNQSINRSRKLQTGAETYTHGVNESFLKFSFVLENDSCVVFIVGQAL